MSNVLIGQESNPFSPFWEKQQPDFVNEQGVKWWLDKDSTRYASKENSNGISLDYQIFVVEEPDGRKTRLVLDEKRKPVYEHTHIESIAVWLDIQKYLKGQPSEG